MAEFLKNWITTIFCIGIFLTFVQIILPNTKLKKYIYSLIGVITVITLVVPIGEKLKIENLEEVAQSVINNMENEISETNNTINTKNGTDITNENLKKEFAKKIKEDMNEKLSDHNIHPEMISIILDDTYNIKKVNIKIKVQDDKTNINTIFNCITKNYSVLDDNISIEEV